MKLKTYTDTEMQELVKKFSYFLKNDISKMLKETDTDLLNIRDEMLAEISNVLILIPSGVIIKLHSLMYGLIISNSCFRITDLLDLILNTLREFSIAKFI